MAAVDHYPWDSIIGVIFFFAEWAFIFVKKFADELIDFFTKKIRRVFGLLEEKSCGVL